MAEYSDKLGAYDEPVAFDDATADALRSAATTLSGTLTSQAASRAGWASAASADFEGHYADVFDANARTASTDCTNIASALDDLVAEVQKLKEAAQAERERRRQAKEWADRQDKENILKRGWDWVTNGDKPPSGPDQVPLSQPHEVTTTPWSEPAPGGAGAVSSARPDDLRAYSSSVAGANDTVTAQKGALEGAIADFAERCSWCGIDASGITGALASFGANNTNETRWVDTVAAAFEAAGASGAVSTVSDAALDASLQAAGVDRTRQPIDVTAPSIQGDPQTSGYADDPVNTTTGNFIEPETDLSFDGGAASLGFERMYNSLSASIGAFGPGWASTADQRLTITDNGAVWVQPSGRHIVFPRLGNGWDRADGDTYWLHTTGPTGEATSAAGTGTAAGAGGDSPTTDGPAAEAGVGTGAAAEAGGVSPATGDVSGGITAMSGARAAGDVSAGGGAHASASDAAPPVLVVSVGALTPPALLLRPLLLAALLLVKGLPPLPPAGSWCRTMRVAGGCSIVRAGPCRCPVARAPGWATGGTTAAWWAWRTSGAGRSPSSGIRRAPGSRPWPPVTGVASTTATTRRAGWWRPLPRAGPAGTGGTRRG